MKSLFRFLANRRDVLSNVCVALCAGSYIGGVLFNTLGAGDDWQNAQVGAALMVMFFIFALITKGGK